MFVINATIAIAGDLSDFASPLQVQFRTNLASLLGVDVTDVTLYVTAGSTIIQASVVVRSFASTRAAMSVLGGNVAQLSASLGVTVTSVSVLGTTSQVLLAPSADLGHSPTATTFAAAVPTPALTTDVVAATFSSTPFSATLVALAALATVTTAFAAATSALATTALPLTTAALAIDTSNPTNGSIDCAGCLSERPLRGHPHTSACCSACSLAVCSASPLPEAPEENA